MSSLEQAFDSTAFRELGHRLVDRLADHLQVTQQANENRVISWQDPAESLACWENLDRSDDVMDLFEQVIQQSIHLHHPRYVGHQISPALPVSALAGLLVDLLNNGMGVYEMGMAGTAIEHVVVKLTARQLGFPTTAGGFLTSGGSLANLTGLLAARQSRLQDGGDDSSLAVMVSAEAHHCVLRAATIMGLGEEGIVQVPSNAKYQMEVDQLERLHQEAAGRGYEVMAIVGNACTTSTGSFDDLAAIGAYCQRHRLWFHVDGAHGAAMAFSEKYCDKLAGIELADSVTLDFHKMLLTPALLSALIFREESNSFDTFRQTADYLWSQNAGRDEAEWFSLAKRTFECTKSMMGLKIYSLLKAHGVEILDENVTRLVDLTRQFARLIEQHASFEIAVQPEANIVCFRYVADVPSSDLSRLNEKIRESVTQQGRFFIVQTTLQDEVWLRTTLANPLTTKQDLEELLEHIDQSANCLLSRLP
ncbi:MAG: pyridoxal-dependent decarboxylase [Pirellulaceae bacterium]|nr:pyridoxal-dependent decarboxylase [Pirellulaceae bacterium]